MSEDGEEQSQTASSATQDAFAVDEKLERSGRKRAPTARYVEQTSSEVLAQIYKTIVKKEKKAARVRDNQKSRNTPDGKTSKWSAYKLKITSLARGIARDKHAMTSYEVEDGNLAATRSVIPKQELQKCIKRIVESKNAILEQFATMDNEYSDHIRWPQLKTGFDADDDVSVEEIMCSACNQPDEDDNDILFCDRKNCLRAYHQQCLEPPQRADSPTLDPDEPWFCRQCACMDECLDLVGEILGHDADDYHELFPELRATGGGGEGQHGMEEDDSEDDVDYAPSGSEGDEENAQSDDEEADGDVVDQVGDEEGKSRRRHGKKKHSAEDGDEADSDGSGGGSENSDNSDEDNSDDDSSGSELGSESQSGGDIEEDELQGLLQDAEAEDLILAGLADQNAPSRSSRAAGGGGTPPRRNLRARRVIDYAALEDKSKTPEGASDVGKCVAAMIRKGVLSEGKITSFRYAEVGWVEEKDRKGFKKITSESDDAEEKGKATGQEEKEVREGGEDGAANAEASAWEGSATSNSALPAASASASTSTPQVVSDATEVASTGCGSETEHSLLGLENSEGPGSSGEEMEVSDQAPTSFSAPLELYFDSVDEHYQSSVEKSEMKQLDEDYFHTEDPAPAGGLALHEALPVPQTLENGVWTARFEGGFEREFGLETLKQYFEFYAEYAQKLLDDDNDGKNKAKKSVENTVAEQGKLDSSNILTTKRTRVALDYAALSKEMFGDKADSGSDDSSVEGLDDEPLGESKRALRRKPRGAEAQHGRTTGILLDAGVTVPVDASFVGEDDEQDASDEADEASETGRVKKRKSRGAQVTPSGRKRGRPRKSTSPPLISQPIQQTTQLSIQSTRPTRPTQSSPPPHSQSPQSMRSGSDAETDGAELDARASLEFSQPPRSPQSGSDAETEGAENDARASLAAMGSTQTASAGAPLASAKKTGRPRTKPAFLAGEEREAARAETAAALMAVREKYRALGQGAEKSAEAKKEITAYSRALYAIAHLPHTAEEAEQRRLEISARNRKNREARAAATGGTPGKSPPGESSGRKRGRPRKSMSAAEVDASHSADESLESMSVSTLGAGDRGERETHSLEGGISALTPAKHPEESVSAGTGRKRVRQRKGDPVVASPSDRSGEYWVLSRNTSPLQMLSRSDEEAAALFALCGAAASEGYEISEGVESTDAPAVQQVPEQGSSSTNQGVSEGSGSEQGPRRKKPKSRPAHLPMVYPAAATTAATPDMDATTAATPLMDTAVAEDTTVTTAPPASPAPALEQETKSELKPPARFDITSTVLMMIEKIEGEVAE